MKQSERKPGAQRAAHGKRIRRRQRNLASAMTQPVLRRNAMGVPFAADRTSTLAEGWKHGASDARLAEQATLKTILQMKRAKDVHEFVRSRLEEIGG